MSGIHDGPARPGQMIGDEYEVLEEIGHGAFAVVYRCREKTLGKIVALKMLTAEVIDRKILDGFFEEGRKLAALNHPNVVQVHRAGVQGQRPYIVMECLEGDTLRHLLLESRLPLKRALDTMAQVARGLQAIHDSGVVHRDLSTNNVMVTRDGTAKILDLGLARLADAGVTAPSTARLVGTLHYIAPEVVEGRAARISADIFSFGTLLYEAVSGRNPFAGENPTAVLYNITNRQPESLESVVPTLPPMLVRLVDQCLQKNPMDRPESLEGVADRIVTCMHEVASAAELPTTAWNGGTRSVSGIGSGSTSSNPYHNRSMIRHAGEFVGRAQEVRRIYSRLNASPPGCISIVGDRRIGKSSLLNYVAMPMNRDSRLDRPDRMVMVLVDLQEHSDTSLENFLRILTELIRKEAGEKIGLQECAPTLDGMKELIRELCAKECRLAILFDEFEIITGNPGFSLEFFSFLRFLANQYDVGYITSSMRDLQQLCHTQEISDSPFFNIFSTMRLSAFSEEEARELISRPSAAAGYPLEAHVEFITRELGGYFPLFLQIACSHLLESLQDGPETPDPELVRRRYIEEAEPHYRFIWSNFSEHERAVMEHVVDRHSVPDSLRDVLVDLETRRYVVPGDSRPRVFATSFAQFLLAHSGRTRRRPLWKRLLGGGKNG